eukprot:scaffold5221_cov397-Prasinococcus_capsulatus_cf.AAC.4
MAVPEQVILASFATLGLCRDNATPEDVKAAYKTLAAQRHPDKGGSEETFQLLQKAYEVCLPEAQLLRCAWMAAALPNNKHLTGYVTPNAVVTVFRSSVLQRREAEVPERAQEEAQRSHKAQGTAFYLDGEYLQAAQQFSEAIRQKEDLPGPLFSNLSAALLRAKQPDEALRAADECVEVEPGWVKGEPHTCQPLRPCRQIGPFAVPRC